MLSWYVIYTAPRAEKRIQKSLTEQGVETFLPLHRVLRQWSDRKKWVELPMFPSYLFLRMNESDYSSVFNVPGVVRFIYFDGKPAIIRDDVITILKKIVKGEEDFEVSSEIFEPGEIVFIYKGALKGFSGELIEYHGKHKVLIRVEQVGHSVLLNLPVSCLRKVGKS